MKKLLLTLALALTGMAGAYANDNIINNPANKPYFGVRLGVDITCPGKLSYTYNIPGEEVREKVFKTGGGFELGAVYNHPIIANLYVEPGLKFYYNSYGFDKNYPDFALTNLHSGIAGSMRTFGMRIPVNIGYHFDFTDDLKVYVFTGPELEIGFTSKAHQNVSDQSIFTDQYSKEGNLHRADLLWGFGVGVSYDRYYFAISGDAGMCNMYKASKSQEFKPDIKFHQNRATITLGYNF